MKNRIITSIISIVILLASMKTFAQPAGGGGGQGQGGQPPGSGTGAPVDGPAVVFLAVVAGYGFRRLSQQDVCID